MQVLKLVTNVTEGVLGEMLLLNIINFLQEKSFEITIKIT